MIGFTAVYGKGTICPEDPEIEDADWFTPDYLPNLPGRISIARRLIDWFVMKHT
jgi:NAD+ diphosphatase